MVILGELGLFYDRGIPVPLGFRVQGFGEVWTLKDDRGSDIKLLGL